MRSASRQLAATSAGVGIFAGPPGAQNWGNGVVGNILTGNGLPGVALHSHTVFQKLTEHSIAGNTISGNGPDSDPGTTTGIDVFSDSTGGAAAITGVVITGNTIKGEEIDIAIKTPGQIDVHLNNLFDDTGIDNLGTGSVNATMNWWKCSRGPTANGCSSLVGSGVQFSPWLTNPFSKND